MNSINISSVAEDGDIGTLPGSRSLLKRWWQGLSVLFALQNSRGWLVHSSVLGFIGGFRTVAHTLHAFGAGLESTEPGAVGQAYPRNG